MDRSWPLNLIVWLILSNKCEMYYPILGKFLSNLLNLIEKQKNSWQINLGALKIFA